MHSKEQAEHFVYTIMLILITCSAILDLFSIKSDL